MAKDIKRYSFSRLKTFHICPRKHHYAYIEQIETEESSVTIPGKLFHECIEKHVTGQDYSSTINEFKKLCLTGKLDLEPDLLEYIVPKYFQYYSKEYQTQQVILTEHEFTDDLEDGDYLVCIVDQAIIEKNGYLFVRDIKTTQNKLKYTQDDVIYNQQLFMYIPFVEDKLQTKVDGVEIDEVRLAKLQSVPIKLNGKPSTDKNQLTLVTYEDYYEELKTRGLEQEKEYLATLDYLKQRGHPLFNRVRAQVLDQNLVASNADDMMQTYHAAKLMPTYRVKGPLCNYCDYKKLCQLDYSNPLSTERQILVDSISKTK